MPPMAITITALLIGSLIATIIRAMIIITTTTHLIIHTRVTMIRTPTCCSRASPAMPLNGHLAPLRSRLVRFSFLLPNSNNLARTVLVMECLNRPNCDENLT